MAKAKFDSRYCGSLFPKAQSAPAVTNWQGDICLTETFEEANEYVPVRKGGKLMVPRYRKESGLKVYVQGTATKGANSNGKPCYMFVMQMIDPASKDGDVVGQLIYRRYVLTGQQEEAIAQREHQPPIAYGNLHFEEGFAKKHGLVEDTAIAVFRRMGTNPHHWVVPRTGPELDQFGSF